MENKIKILDVINLIPVQIKCEINNVLQTVMGYIDYNNYTVIINDARFNSDIIRDLQQLAITHLSESQTQRDAELIRKAPDEAYQQMRLYKSEDYLDPQLSDQLKEGNIHGERKA